MKRFLLVFLTILCFLNLVNIGSKANTNEKFQTNLQNRGIVISPVVIYLKGDKNVVIGSQFELTNDSADSSELNITISNFVQNTDGSVVIDTTVRGNDFNFAKWIKIQNSSISIKSNEIKTVNFTVEIPSDAANGSHSALISISRQDKGVSQNTNAALIKDEINIPVLLTIGSEKDVIFDATTSDLQIKNIKDESVDIFLYGKASSKVEITNKGNIYVRPFGNIFIHKGDKTKPLETLDFNTAGLLVQQRNQRVYRMDSSLNNFINEEVDSWANPSKYNLSKFFDFKFGRYYVTYRSRILPASEVGIDKDKVISEERTVSFFVFPIQILVLLIIVITACSLLGINKLVSNKRRNIKKL